MPMDFCGAEHDLGRASGRLQTMLDDAAIPRLDDQAIGRQVAIREIITDERAQVDGAGQARLQGHEDSECGSARQCAKRMIIVVVLEQNRLRLIAQSFRL
jgi:hypothetical protein